MILSTISAPRDGENTCKEFKKIKYTPLLNSEVMIIWVEAVTLCVEHIAGYAGVMIGIRWARSPG